MKMIRLADTINFMITTLKIDKPAIVFRSILLVELIFPCNEPPPYAIALVVLTQDEFRDSNVDLVFEDLGSLSKRHSNLILQIILRCKIFRN